ncbi:MAG: zinc metalloprotease HtpX [archaeon]
MDNRVKTVLFLGLLSGLLLWIGHLIGGYSGLTIGLAIALLMNISSYWWSDKVVLAMYRAKEADKNQHPDLYAMIHEAARHMKIPSPKIFLVDSPTPNAFATGRDPHHAAVAFTTSIISLLNKDELKGVAAHELAHIRQRDTLIQTAAATIASVISYVAFMARWAAIFGGVGKDSDDGGSIIEFLVLALLAPVIATILQLALSRSREYLADERAAKALHSGQGLAEALLKIEGAVKEHPMRGGNPTTAPLFIINPFRAKTFLSLFSTHPPVEERVKRLRKIH